MDSSQLAPATALSSAIGYAIPLVIGLVTHHLADGVSASAGALIVGFANFGGSYRVRAWALLVSTVAAGVAALVGGLAGPSIAVTVIVISLWGFCAGLLVAYGRQTALVGMLSVWALLLASDLHLHGMAVVHETWLILAGGAVQMLVVMAMWPVRSYAPERQSVANAYASLARCARSPGSQTFQACAGGLQAAAQTVGRLSPTSGERNSIRRMVEQGEWIRIELAALAGLDAQRLLDAAADVLEAIAEHGDTSVPLGILNDRVGELPDLAIRQRAQALNRWVTAAAVRAVTEVPISAVRSRPVEVLRAEMKLQSSTLRHAVRLAVALGVAAALYRGLSLGSGYWIPLSVLFVLKPDYGTTLSRALGRAMGTGVGVTIAWVIVTPFSPSDQLIVVLLTLLAYSAYAIFSASYALYSMLLAVLIASLVEFSGGSPVGALGNRLLDTAIGTAIALVAISVWPTRESARTREALAAFVVTEGRWVDAAFEAFSGADSGALRVARLATRPVRTAAYEAVRRALNDSPGRRPEERPLRAVLTAMDDISESTLAIVASVHEGILFPASELVPMRMDMAKRFAVIASILTNPKDETPDRRNLETVEGPGTMPQSALFLIAQTLALLEQTLIRVPSGGGQ